MAIKSINGLGIKRKPVERINNIPLTKTVNPIGLIRGREPQTLDNVELRATLDKAVEDAQLNVTERLALNKTFFPNGGGFELFPPSIQVPNYTYYFQKGQLEQDAFTKEATALKIPEDVCMIKETVRHSKKSCYEKNLENAIQKLQQVLKGNI